MNSQKGNNKPMKNSRNCNSVYLRGNVGGKTPELRNTNNGTVVTDFFLATTKNWIDKTSNEEKSKTTWHKIVAWGETAKYVVANIEKGDLVIIEDGEINHREYDTPEGKRISYEIETSKIYPVKKYEKKFNNQ